LLPGVCRADATDDRRPRRDHARRSPAGDPGGSARPLPELVVGSL
ncbi:MAG: hypothetical protein AVDCRST_MAG70-316, partial [uncultured Thermomicrobiales bacterium]